VAAWAQLMKIRTIIGPDHSLTAAEKNPGSCVLVSSLPSKLPCKECDMSQSEYNHIAIELNIEYQDSKAINYKTKLRREKKK
jgi:hypothetical protein